MTDRTVERMAAAMYAATAGPLTWAETGRPEHRLYRALARAALTYLRADIDVIYQRLGQEAMIRGWVYDPASEFWQALDRVGALLAELDATEE